MFVLDSHCDTPSQIHRLRDLRKDNPRAQVDFPKLKRGGVDGAFFAIYVPASLGDGTVGSVGSEGSVGSVGSDVKKGSEATEYARTLLREVISLPWPLTPPRPSATSLRAFFPYSLA